MHPTLNWILSCRCEQGGFGLYPGDGPNLRATHAAVKALGLLREAVPDSDKHTAFILSQQGDDGGFFNRFGRWPEESAMINSFHAVDALITLKAPVPSEKILPWIRSRQNSDGGYLWDYWLPENYRGKSSIRESFFALETLAAMGEKTEQADKLADFLSERQQNTQHNDGSFNLWDMPINTDTPAGVGLTCFTAMGLAAYKRLGSELPDKKGALTYLLKQHNRKGGIEKGLGVYKAYDDRHICRMTDAYYGVLGLVSIGESVTDKSALARWIGSCQNSDGGFGRRPVDCPSDMEATFQALHILSRIGADIPLPANPAPSPVLPAGQPKFPCPQIFLNDPDEVKYLVRIAQPIYEKHISKGEFAAAMALLTWVGDNQLFTSNYKQSGANIIIDTFATCGPKARAYVSLANAMGIKSRMLYILGHGCAESRIDGKWTMMDPMFYDYGHDNSGELRSAVEIHANFLDRGKDWTVFGDFRYEEFDIEKPEGGMWHISPGMTPKEAVAIGAYD